MSKPSSLREMIELLRRSQVVDSVRLESFFESLKAGNTKNLTPQDLLDHLLGESLITKFQADLLSNGKWKGFTLGGYRILDKIASGGMGQVFVGEHLKLRKKVAIKVLAANLTENHVARQRFVREARAAATLSHEHIVQVFDVNIDVNPPYLVMEYVEGITLQAAVALSGPMSPAAAAVCGHQMALGLQHAFEHGLVHRDIKPANAIIDRKGSVKLLDLGIARFDDGLDLTRIARKEKLILGTVEYLAPEQAIDSTKVDTRADIYSLGATLYFLLLGEPPFARAASSAKLLLKQTEMPTMISELRSDVPVELASVIQHMLAIKPQNRFATPADAANALAPFAIAPPDFPESCFRRVPPRSWDTEQTHPVGTRNNRYSKTPSSVPTRSSSFESFSPSMELEKTDLTIPAVAVMAPAATFDFERLSSDETVADTQTPSPARTLTAIGRKSSRLIPVAETIPTRKKRWLIGGLVVGVALIAGLSYAIASFLMPAASRHDSSKAKSKSTNRSVDSHNASAIPDSSTTTLIVAKTGKPGHYPSITAAIEAAKDQVNRIEVWEDQLEEIVTFGVSTTPPAQLSIIGKGPATGRTVIVTPPTVKKTDWSHRIVAPNGVTLDHLTFDGRGEAAYLVNVQGANITLRDLVLRQYTNSGLALTAVNGLTMTGCRLSPVMSGEATNNLSIHTSSQRLVIHNNRFDGPVIHGIQDVGLVDAQIIGNRFHDCTNALSLQTIPVSGLGLHIRQNAFSNAEHAMHFAKPPAVGPTLRPQALTIDGNTFVNVVHSATTAGVRLTPEKPIARKIWISDDSATGVTKKNVVGQFRTTFDLTADDIKPGVRFRLDGVAHSAYRAWINSTPLSIAGNGNWVRGRQIVETIDLTPHVRPGRNVVAIAVASGEPAQANATDIVGEDDDRTPADPQAKRPFLLARIRNSTTNVDLATTGSSSWKTGYSKSRLWNQPEFDDSTWTAPWPVVDSAKNPEPCPEVWISEIETQFPGVSHRFSAGGNIAVGKLPQSGFPYFPTHLSPDSPGLIGKDDVTFLRFRPGTFTADVEARIGMIIGTSIPLPPLPPEPIAK